MHRCGRVRMVADGEWWQASLTSKDDASYGWRATYELSYDLSLFRLGASVTYGHDDSRLQRGRYRTLALTASRKFRLSHWMLAWISLGVGTQRWFGDEPPPGEADQRTLMLGIGTTFR